MLDLERLLNVRGAYAGRLDSDGRLLFVSDLAGVPQVWQAAPGRMPELVLAPADRAQTLYPGIRPGQLIVGADLAGDEHTQLLLIGSEGAAVRPFTNDPAHIFHFGDWAPEGERIAFDGNQRSGRWSDVYVADIAGREWRRVLTDDSTNRAGRFSPDGRWLVVTRVRAHDRQELWLVDLSGSESPRPLATDPAAQYGRPEWFPDGRALMVVSDQGQDLASPMRLDISSGELTPLVSVKQDTDDAVLNRDGEYLAYALNDNGAARLCVRHLATGQERVVPGLPPGALYDYWQSGLAWDRSGRRLAISWTASRGNPNVWRYDTATGTTTQLTFAPHDGVPLEALVEPEQVQYPTFDARQVPALYYPAVRPLGGSEPPPCVVVVHGGPEGQFRPTFQPVVQYLVSAGFAVLAPNVRGSTGYGRAYSHLDDVRQRMDSVADLAHAAYWLRDRRRARPDRIAVYGGSYGGFMVLAALTTYPELWAAGVDIVGIANFITFLENTGPWRRHLREAEYGSLEHHREFLASISPIHQVERIRAPLLVIHGANDPRVPVSEAEQLVARLRALGRTVEFLRLEDEGHQISKLRNKLRAYPLAVDFLTRHLLGSTPQP